MEAVESLPLSLASTPAGGSYSSFIATFGTTSQMADALTIRLRILSRLNRIAPLRARDLFEKATIEAPSGRVECSATSIQSVGEHYYPTLTSLNLPNPVLQAPIYSLPQLAALVGYLGTTKYSGNLDELALKAAGAFKQLVVSDRVFTTSELGLQLGQNLTTFLQRNDLSSSIKVLLSNEYRTFVLRQLKQPRCNDVIRRGEDLLLKQVLKRVNELATLYQSRPVDAKEIPAPNYIKSPAIKRPPVDVTAEFPGDLDRYEKRGTSEDRARVEADIDAVIKLEASDCKPCDLATRVGSLIFFVSRLGGDHLSEQAVSAAFSIVALNQVKTTHPGLWIYVAKQLVNLTHHPSPKVSQFVTQLLHQTADPDLNVYGEHERLFGKSNAYITDALTKSDAFAAAF